MIPTHIKKIKHSTVCVTGVYLRDITNTVFCCCDFALDYESSERLLFLL